mmetsp:Transcript_32025/g.23184  ORF Transcript_32025/g.23184 Transcript_32025/m.23184 type:complete len:101 (+) Transcript_32025:489-791(+)|eukprot:CAMPEP_0116882952 /NCGR_PEP_ID=MMETSP0463-20121206/15350_1 /TAXON_ID=181622 /ORGANISM="Strombidinopsis sp, Strain SopsisLIS2011" /LENGTH=100 /DNA_ID=CAMNT_0004536983 /DNA_START=396 /DNA_END=701 /DNA_ORIENTATION=-
MQVKTRKASQAEEEVKEEPEAVYEDNPNRIQISKEQILSRFKLVKEMDFSVFKDSTLVDFVDMFNSEPIVPENVEKTDKPAEGSQMQTFHPKPSNQNSRY